MPIPSKIEKEAWGAFLKGGSIPFFFNFADITTPDYSKTLMQANKEVKEVDALCSTEKSKD